MKPTGKYLTHTTERGDRWDLLAATYYNDATAYSLIIEANRELFLDDLSPIPAILPPRLELKIPVVEQETIDPALLPPWRR